MNVLPPQDHAVLREGAAPPRVGLIEPRSTALWVLLSLPILGYFVWYFRAQCDCRRLIDDASDPWLWMAMLFPGMILVVPYAIAQARIAARVEIATRRPLGTVLYVVLCAAGFFVPALLPLVLQRRLNEAARMDPGELRRLRVG
jgi:hypothetical protein